MILPVVVRSVKLVVGGAAPRATETENKFICWLAIITWTARVLNFRISATFMNEVALFSFYVNLYNKLTKICDKLGSKVYKQIWFIASNSIRQTFLGYSDSSFLHVLAGWPTEWLTNEQTNLQTTRPTDQKL